METNPLGCPGGLEVIGSMGYFTYITYLKNSYKLDILGWNNLQIRSPLILTNPIRDIHLTHQPTPVANLRVEWQRVARLGFGGWWGKGLVGYLPLFTTGFIHPKWVQDFSHQQGWMGNNLPETKPAILPSEKWWRETIAFPFGARSIFRGVCC